MLGYNRVILIGSLTRDPEIRYNPKGDRVVRITLGLPNERMTMDHFDVVFLSGNQGNFTEKLREGQWVLIEGKMKQRRWKTPEGQSRERVEIIADTIRQIERDPGRQTSHR